MHDAWPLKPPLNTPGWPQARVRGHPPIIRPQPATKGLWLNLIGIFWIPTLVILYSGRGSASSRKIGFLRPLLPVFRTLFPWPFPSPPATQAHTRARPLHDGAFAHVWACVALVAGLLEDNPAPRRPPRRSHTPAVPAGANRSPEKTGDRRGARRPRSGVLLRTQYSAHARRGRPPLMKRGGRPRLRLFPYTPGRRRPTRRPPRTRTPRVPPPPPPPACPSVRPAAPNAPA